MKAYDYDAVTYNGAVYCVECLPPGVDVESDEVYPIFADSEWDYYPVCSECGTKHDYVILTTEGKLYEFARQLGFFDCLDLRNRTDFYSGKDSIRYGIAYLGKESDIYYVLEYKFNRGKVIGIKLLDTFYDYAEAYDYIKEVVGEK